MTLETKESRSQWMDMLELMEALPTILIVIGHRLRKGQRLRTPAARITEAALEGDPKWLILI